MKELHYINKNWGKTVKIGDYGSVKPISIWHGFVEEHGTCSIHHHNFHANEIVATDCVICIDFYDNGFHVIDSIMLGCKQSIVIPSQRIHAFRVRKSGSMIEIYWPDKPLPEHYDSQNFDIIRHST